MQIDWFTLSAQIINFLILLFLLKRFLFDRIVGAMDRREEKIGSRLEEAEQSKSEAENRRRDYEQRKEELEEKRDQVLADAREAAEQEKKKLRDAARQDIESLRNKWRESLQNEQDDFIREFRRRTGEEIYRVTRKMLGDMADQDLEKQMIPVFLQRIHNLSENEVKEITQSIDDQNDSVSVVSSFEIDTGQRSNISRKLNDKFNRKLAVDYQRSGELICGIEFQAGNRLITWSVSHYLDQLEQRTRNYLEA